MLDWLSSVGHDGVMGEVRGRWAKLPPAERERRLAQSAADRARGGGSAAASPLLPEAERRRRQSQSDNGRARAEQWAGLPEDERRRRQSQSDADRARPRRGGAQGFAAGAAELENDETLQAMWHTIENGGPDFMSKGDW